MRGKRGRPRRKPRALYADRSYDHEVPLAGPDRLGLLDQVRGREPE